MATIDKRGDLQWRARVRVKGFPVQTKTFLTKADAEKWAKVTESEMIRGVFIPRSESEKTTLGEIITRYRIEILPSKKGAQQDGYRLKTLAKEFGPYALAAITPAMIAEFRDKRAKVVSGQTVIHELGVLTRLFKAAVMDWGIALPGGIPTAMVRKPKREPGRDRRLSPDEEKALLDALTPKAPGMGAQNPWIRPAFELAIETGMRRGEMLRLMWDDVDLKKRTAKLRDTKNGEDRAIPLSTRAVTVLQELPRSISGRVIPISENALKLAWQRARKKVGADGLRFHDLRHEAASRFFEKGLEIMEVATITGHRSLSMLKRYTHLRAEDLARKLG